MKRGGPIARHTHLRSGSGPSRGRRIKGKNPARRASELLRCYGPPERRAWLKAQPCLMCGGSPVDQAHVRGDGAGRKSDYTNLVPLCRRDHMAYDQHRPPFDDPVTRDYVKLAAEKYQQRWLEYANQQGIAA